MLSKYVYVLLLCGLVFFTGCAERLSLSGSYLIPQEEPPSKPISRRIVLVADNQIHNQYGQPIPILRSGASDRLVQTAIRPVQLDFYGQDVLQWLVQNQGVDTPIVHLGDACDLSCTEEFETFCNIMLNAATGWVMAPGNHEGFFFGNEHRDVREGKWPDACQNAGQPMTKADFVKLYLAALTLQNGPGFQALTQYVQLPSLPRESSEQASCAVLEQRAAAIPDRGQWRYEDSQNSAPPLLRAIAWRSDAVRPWHSFVVQEVELTHAAALTDASASVRAILLDTSQYEVPPLLVSTILNAGVTGSVRADQLDIVNAWIASHRHPKPVWVPMGHHPFDRLNPWTQKRLHAIRRRATSPLYVSAHTHAGQFLVHRESQRAVANNGAERTSWLELNLGSILDWPMEFRTLEFARTDTSGRLVLRSPRFTMPEQLQASEGIPSTDETWEAKPQDPDYYLNHEDFKDPNADRTEHRLKNFFTRDPPPIASPQSDASG